MTTNNTQAVLQGYVKRIENLTAERQTFSDDIKDVYNEAESEGFDKKALKQIIARRKKDRAEVDNLDAVVETYEAALGVF